MSANIFWQNFKPDVKAPGPSSHCENPVVCYHNFSRKRGHDQGGERHDQGGEGKWQWRQRNPNQEIGRNPWQWNEITMDGQKEDENQTSRARSASRSCQFCGTQFQCRRRGMSKRGCRGGERRWKGVWTIHSVTNTCGSFDTFKAKQKLIKWLKCDKAQIHN